MLDESLLVETSGGVRNAVITLRRRGLQPPLRPRRIVLDNRDCAFRPHVQAVSLGSEVLLKNSDPILHTVHARLGDQTLFNVGLPKWREVRKVLDRAGAIRIDCGVLHTWMSAVIVVSTSPYLAVTDQDGRFSVGPLPAGDYRLEVWHERLGTRGATVVVGEGTDTFLEVAYALP
ncbi:MAG TPA: carboxypeptidase regulatory-like domain-containing protein [candidate division Zixibacteria bacterium]|nr:carboxypeptidase regulatory-like domain-containing protein [candidate division Zixibacteria bacterium]